MGVPFDEKKRILVGNNMSRTLKIEVNPTVFKWLGEGSGWSVDTVSQHLGVTVESVVAKNKLEKRCSDG